MDETLDRFMKSVDIRVHLCPNAAGPKDMEWGPADGRAMHVFDGMSEIVGLHRNGYRNVRCATLLHQGSGATCPKKFAMNDKEINGALPMGADTRGSVGDHQPVGGDNAGTHSSHVSRLGIKIAT
jgi:hypothetical protein